MRRFEKSPQVLSLHNFLVQANSSTIEINGMVVPMRPSPTTTGIRNRFKCAWQVFTGKADAVTWPLDQ